MRGLTPLERWYLSQEPGSAKFPWMGELHRAGIEMARVGRTRRIEDGRVTRYQRTDLGRLALRVCPVDEF